MFVLCKVCAKFRDKRGNEIFTFDRGNLFDFIEVPDAIQEDPLFEMLHADGSLTCNPTAAEKKALENDPMAGMDASGKRKTAKAAPSPTGKAVDKDTTKGDGPGDIEEHPRTEK